jgi:DNA-binding XRE family transcriptional regulator
VRELGSYTESHRLAKKGWRNLRRFNRRHHRHRQTSASNVSLWASFPIPIICTIVSGTIVCIVAVLNCACNGIAVVVLPPRTAEDIFGGVLREARKGRGFSQEDLAFKSGYHPTYIGQVERGRKSPSLRAILRFATALDTPGSELLKRVEVLVGAGR